MAPLEVGTAEDASGTRHRVMVISGEYRKWCEPAERWREWTPYSTFESNVSMPGFVPTQKPTCLACIAGLCGGSR